MEVDQKPGSVTIVHPDSTTPQLKIADDTAAGSHALWLNGNKVSDPVVVPEWTITKAEWSTNALSVEGTSLDQIKAIALQKTGEATVKLTKDNASDKTKLTAKTAPLPVGDYQLLVDDIWTGDIVKVS